MFPLNLEKVCSEWIHHCVPSQGSDFEEGNSERLLTPGRSLQGNGGEAAACDEVWYQSEEQ